MREGWEYKKLGDVCSFKRGLTYSGKDEVEHSDNVVLRSNNVDLETFSLNFDELKYISEEIQIPADKKLKKGTLLMCMSNGSKQHLGKVAYIDQDYPYAFGGFMGLLCPNDSIISPKFLYFYCCSPTYKNFLSHIGNGANINNLKFSQLSDNLIPLPSIKIQKSIVSELELIHELIAKKKVQLADLDSLAMSMFYEMFGDPVENPNRWPVQSIGEVGSVERGAGISKKDFIEEGVPCIHYGQLHTSFGPYTKKHLTCIPEDLLPKYKIAHTGDLLMAITSEDVEGSCKSSAWLGEYDIIVGSDAAILHHNQNGIYLSYYTMTKAFYNEKAKYAKGFKVTHISAKEIESINILVPPIELQNSFAEKMEMIEEQKKMISDSISDLETLLASRMQYYFD